ncbi:MAG: type IX secretion system outer membrane channel protein PorV [Sphingobacteriaceae bacterium]|nr:type IX secretion system outer membrane channel protein PorV [Sphingobacteriaceae bacterium]
MKFCALPIFFLGLITSAAAQSIGPGAMNSNGSNANAITTAVPFLTISPDARSGAMGEAGVALSADANAIYWNSSKLAHMENTSNMSASYTPWLQKLDNDMYVSFFSFAHKLSDRNAFGLSLKYFNLGEVNIYDENINSLGQYKPNEFTFDAAFARKFSNNFSLGLNLRYINSSLTNMGEVEGRQVEQVDAVALDVSAYYKKPVKQFGYDALLAFGANMSNIGEKINYSDSQNKYFLPTNLKVGMANTWYLDSKNELTFALDLNKLLVPTPPVRNSTGAVIDGKDDNRSVVSGIFGSFGDAPGGFKEEFKEISYASGLEYLYNKQFAVRAGYYYENPDKGARNYLTLGAGLKYEMLDLNFSYLAGAADRSPLASTLRFSMIYNFTGK